MVRQLVAGAALVFGSTALASAAVAQGATPLAAGVGDCATVTASVRMQAVGFNHIVTLANHCSRAVSCEVWTNVDPTPRFTLRAKPGQNAETITRVGSPSRDVQAGELCHFEG